jgi:hypothetical protein
LPVIVGCDLVAFVHDLFKLIFSIVLFLVLFVELLDLFRYFVVEIVVAEVHVEEIVVAVVVNSNQTLADCLKNYDLVLYQHSALSICVRV